MTRVRWDIERHITSLISLLYAQSDVFLLICRNLLGTSM